MRGRSWALLVACAATIFCVGPRRAYADELTDCLGGTQPIAGTNAYRLARAAMVTNAQTFSAASSLERNVFPVLAVGKQASKQGQAFAFVLENNFLWNALQVPTVEPKCPAEYRYAQRPLDLGASSMAIGARFGAVGFFGGAGMTYSRLGDSPYLRYGLLPAATTLYAPFVAIAAPVKRLDYQSGVNSLTTDYILGASLDTRFVDARAGYVLSSGFYAHLGQPDVHGFLGMLLAEGASELAYLRGGFLRIQSLLGETTAFARLLPLTAPSRDDLASAVPLDEVKKRQRFLTAHLEQVNIAKYVDLDLAYAIQPSPSIHKTVLGFHSKGYRPSPPGNVKEWREAQKATREGILGYGLRVGFVHTPDRWFYGQEEGWRLTARLQATVTSADWDGKSISILRALLGLRYNDEELLAIFPYARDALDLYISLQYFQ